MTTPPDRRCGAKNRAGNPCGLRPLKGKTRCKLHGGRTPTGTKGNRKHGLYSQHMTEAEQAKWDGLQLGVVDDELRMLRVYLDRCIALDAQISQPVGANGLELAEVKRSTLGEDGSRTDTVSRRPDVMGRIDRLVGRIGQLEKVRSELIQAAAERGDDPGDKAREIAVALRAMVEIETVPPGGSGDAADDAGDDDGV